MADHVLKCGWMTGLRANDRRCGAVATMVVGIEAYTPPLNGGLHETRRAVLALCQEHEALATRRPRP